VAAPTYIAKFSVVIFTKMQSLRPCTYLLSSLGLPGLCMFSVLLWFGSHCNYSHGKLHPNVERRRGEETHSLGWIAGAAEDTEASWEGRTHGDQEELGSQWRVRVEVVTTVNFLPYFPQREPES